MAKRQNHKGTTDESNDLSKQTILRLDSPTDAELSPEGLEILNLFKANARNLLHTLDQLIEEVEAPSSEPTIKKQEKHYDDYEEDEYFEKAKKASSDSEYESLFDSDSETKDEDHTLIKSDSLIEILPTQTAESLIITTTENDSISRECCGIEGMNPCPIL